MFLMQQLLEFIGLCIIAVVWLGCIVFFWGGLIIVGFLLLGSAA